MSYPTLNAYDQGASSRLSEQHTANVNFATNSVTAVQQVLPVDRENALKALQAIPNQSAIDALENLGKVHADLPVLTALVWSHLRTPNLIPQANSNQPEGFQETIIQKLYQIDDLDGESFRYCTERYVLSTTGRADPLRRFDANTSSAEAAPSIMTEMALLSKCLSDVLVAEQAEQKPIGYTNPMHELQRPVQTHNRFEPIAHMSTQYANSDGGVCSYPIDLFSDLNPLHAPQLANASHSVPSRALFTHGALAAADRAIHGLTLLANHASDQVRRAAGVFHPVVQPTGVQHGVQVLQELKRLLLQNPPMPWSMLVGEVTRQNPNLAVLLMALDSSLRIVDLSDAHITTRYPMVRNYTVLEDALRNGDFGQPDEFQMKGLFHTFAPSIRAIFDLHDDSRVSFVVAKPDVSQPSEWGPKLNRPQAIAHALEDAYVHLQHPERIALNAQNPDLKKTYPMLVYETLAKVLDIAVPAAIVQHEQAVARTIGQNVQAEHNERTQREAIQAQKAIELKQQIARNIQNGLAENIDLATRQKILLGRDLKPDHVCNSAITSEFAVRGYGAVGEIERRLQATHIRQSVAHKAMGEHGNVSQHQDNLCWLRASWLSVMTQMQPQALYNRLLQLYQGMQLEMTPEKKRQAIAHLSQHDLHYLKELAQWFQQDPAQFMAGALGSASGQQFNPHQPMPLQPGNPAWLAQGINLRQISSETAQGAPIRPESLLKQLQFEVLSMFRHEKRGLMNRLASASEFSPGDADLPILLHRALGLPAMVVEAGRGQYEQAVEQSQSVVVTIPKGHSLEPTLAHLQRAQISAIPPAGPEFQRLHFAFQALPVLILREGHFDIYLPRVVLNQLMFTQVNAPLPNIQLDLTPAPMAVTARPSPQHPRGQAGPSAPGPNRSQAPAEQPLKKKTGWFLPYRY